MNANPLVSVIIPAYGHDKYVERTLHSVFAQTFTDYEIIVINDGSPDNTDTVLAPYAASGKIRYHRQQNAGVATTRNRGIALSQGQFIALLDDDDLWPPDKLAHQVAALQQHPDVVTVYGRLAFIDGDNNPMTPLDTAGNPLSLPCDSIDNPGPSGDVFTAFVENNRIISPGQCLIRRVALDRLGEVPFDSAIWGADDWDLWLRLAETGPFLYQPEIALRYRFHARNASHNVVRMRENCLKLLRKHRTRQKAVPARYRMLSERYIWWLAQTYEHFVHLAWMDYTAGNHREGLHKLRFIATVNPRACLNRKYAGMLIRLLRAAGRGGK
jgi:glycosyltransferase involved in cell wall biosynthesis